jgi:predicted acetyltransferase
MIEVRCPRPDELDEMLSVMCEAFHLPFGPARDVFYRDPYFDVRHKRVLTVDGRIASCLTIVDSPMCIGQSVVRVAGVAGVATRPADRRRGYATRLLEEALPILREEGYGLAALFATAPSFYKRLNWEPASVQVQLTTSPGSVLASREGRYARAALPSDIPDLVRLYNSWSEGRSGSRVRDEKRWRYLFEHVKHRLVYKRREAEGYALYDIRETVGKRPTLKLLELVTETDAAQRGLHDHLCHRADCDAIEYTAGWREVEESGLVRAAGDSPKDSTAAPSIQLLPGPLVRIVDLEQCLRGLLSTCSGFEGAATLVLRDRAAEKKVCVSVVIEGSGSGVEVRPASDRDSPRSIIEGDCRTWSAVTVGHLSLADGIALGRLRSSTDAVTAKVAPLFPRRRFFIPVADHF